LSRPGSRPLRCFFKAIRDRLRSATTGVAHQHANRPHGDSCSGTWCFSTATAPHHRPRPCAHIVSVVRTVRKFRKAPQGRVPGSAAAWAGPATACQSLAEGGDWAAAAGVTALADGGATTSSSCWGRLRWSPCLRPRGHGRGRTGSQGSAPAVRGGSDGFDSRYFRHTAILPRRTPTGCRRCSMLPRSSPSGLAGGRSHYGDRPGIHVVIARNTGRLLDGLRGDVGSGVRFLRDRHRRGEGDCADWLRTTFDAITRDAQHAAQPAHRRFGDRRRFACRRRAGANDRATDQSSSPEDPPPAAQTKKKTPTPPSHHSPWSFAYCPCCIRYRTPTALRTRVI